MINYDDFKKIEMKVAKIITAERVEGSEKLLRLDIDLGGEQRQLVAGIAKSYNPEDLAGKKIVVVVNLEPRKLMGLESNGMLLAAHDEAGPILLVPDGEAVPGAGIN
jgi:methionine--tRNA ligase beta chain